MTHLLGRAEVDKAIRLVQLREGVRRRERLWWSSRDNFVDKLWEIVWCHGWYRREYVSFKGFIEMR